MDVAEDHGDFRSVAHPRWVARFETLSTYRYTQSAKTSCCSAHISQRHSAIGSRVWRGRSNATRPNVAKALDR